MVQLSRFPHLPLSSRMLHSVTLLVLAVSSLASAISPCPDQNSSNSMNVSLRPSPTRNDTYLLIFRDYEEAMPIYDDTEIENADVLINFTGCLLEAECSDGSWVGNMTLEIMQCNTVLPDLPIDAVVTQCNSTDDLVTLFITEGSCNRTVDSESDQQTPPLLTSETIRQCNFTGQSVCADYCDTHDAFRVSNDTDDTADTPFAMLSNEEKLSDFCTCLKMADANCSESRGTCEEFCNSIRSPRRTLCREDIEPCNSVSLTNPDTESCSRLCRDNLRQGVGSPCDFLIQDSCENAISTLFTVRESICDGSEVSPEQIRIFVKALRDFINFQDFFVKTDILQVYLQPSVQFFLRESSTSTCEAALLEEFDVQLRKLYVDVLDNVLSEDNEEIFPIMISENDSTTPQEKVNKIIDLALKRFAEVAIRPTSPVNSVELIREHIYFHISRLNASNVDEERNEFTLRINESVFRGTELVIPLNGINYLMNETVASVMVTQNLASYLDPVDSFTNNYIEKNEMSNGVLVSVRLLQRQNSLDDLVDIEDFSDAPVKLVVPQKSNLTNSRCVFWDTQGRLWSEEGVKTVSDPSDLLVQCKISHFTSFAILGSLRAEVLTELPQAEQEALEIVTYVGCAISIVALVLTILALVLFRRILNKGPLLYIHLNLAIALLMVYILFVSTVEPARNIYGLCIVSTAFLHYFLLCSVCWMLSEGVMLYLMIVRVFGAAAEKWYWFMLLGWGVPLPVVFLSATIIEVTSKNSYFYKDTYCWLNPDFTKPAIWTFIVPMAIIVVINSVFLVLTLYHMLRGRKKGGAEAHVKNMELVKHGVKATIILLPLLGITWIIGIFLFSKNTSVFAWLFTIFNSLQGFFFFTLHVVRNDALQAKFCDRFCCKRFRDRSISTADKSMSSILKLREAGVHLLRRGSRSSSSCYDSKSSNLDKKNEGNEGLAATIIVNGFSDSVRTPSPNGICHAHNEGFSHASYSEFQMPSTIDPSDDVVFTNGHTPSSP